MGAGLAGLTAARDLLAAGHSVAVVEARDRVGGRTLNEPLDDGKVVEVGGQWIGPTQDRMAALAREMGVDTFPTHAQGENLNEWRGTHAPLQGHDPQDQPRRAGGRRAGPAAAEPHGAGRCRWTARGPPPRRQVGLHDRAHLDGALDGHARRQGPAGAGRAVGLGHRARGLLAAAHAVLHPLRRQPGDAVRHRGRRAGEPLRGRLAAGVAAAGRAAGRRRGPPGARRCAGSSTAATA